MPAQSAGRPRTAALARRSRYLGLSRSAEAFATPMLTRFRDLATGVGSPHALTRPTGSDAYTNVQPGHPPVYESLTIVQWSRAREASYSP